MARHNDLQDRGLIQKRADICCPCMASMLLYCDYVWEQNFVRLKFCIFAETSLLLNVQRFNFRGFVMGVITMPFSGLVVQWYSWISEQKMAKENNTQSFSSVVSGWMKVTKECHSRACLAQRRRVFLRGRSLTKILPGFFCGLAGALENHKI